MIRPRDTTRRWKNPFRPPATKRRRIVSMDNSTWKDFQTFQAQQRLEVCRQVLQIVMSRDFLDITTQIWCDAIDSGDIRWIKFWKPQYPNHVVLKDNSTNMASLVLPLTYAVQRRAWKVVEWMVRQGGFDPNVLPSFNICDCGSKQVVRRECGDFVLIEAIKWGHLPTVRLLLDHLLYAAASITYHPPHSNNFAEEKFDNNGYSVLHWACHWGMFMPYQEKQHTDAYHQRVEIVELLLDRLGNDMVNAVHFRNPVSPLHLVCSSCRTDTKATLHEKIRLLKLLLDRGASLHWVDMRGRTPFEAALQCKNWWASEYILRSFPLLFVGELSAQTARTHFHECLPLTFLARGVSWIEYLDFHDDLNITESLQKYCAPSLRNLLKMFLSATLLGDCALVEAIVVSVAKHWEDFQCALDHINKPQSWSSGTVTFLELFYVTGSRPGVERLLMEVFGVDPRIQNDKGEQAIHYAALFSSGPRAVEILLDQTKFPVDIDARDNFGESAIFKACQSDNIQTVRYLWKRSADCSPSPITGDTLLHVACRFKQINVIDFCLDEIGMHLDTVNPLTGETPLMVACSDESTIPLAMFLLEKNASPDITDLKGERAEDKLPDCGEKDAVLEMLAKMRWKKQNEQRRKVVNAVVQFGAAVVCVGLWHGMADEIPSTAMDPSFFWQG